MKALILMETVRQVTELKQKVSNVALQHDGNGWCNYNGTSGSFMFPGESDEAIMGYCNGGDGKIVKVTMCCKYRPSLNRDLVETIRLAIKLEIATIGGRMKAEVVQWQEGGGGKEDVGSLRRALNTLVESQASSYLGHLMTINSHNGLGLEIPTNKWAGICGSLELAKDLEKLLLKTV
ncbi:putative transcription factor bHLH107 [Camellia lanceoleosa]|uniref:Transcription factor bHLH107 n=1 Tax=Camellia lanceoleosa TaxID=1840588 RepID=A0ACC0HPD9_9ERIC|nr:putative transcription factor bHLH107 [Camellia lanceoleosa]